MSDPDHPRANPLKRIALMVLGTVFVIVAAIGVFLPGLPATGPLILASICLTKSSPALERRLVRSRFFAPFHQYLDGSARMPMKARLIAIGMMWLCIGLSLYGLVAKEMAYGWSVGVIVAAGLLGTWCIFRFRSGHMHKND